jgi:MoxR-like ATPase
VEELEAALADHAYLADRGLTTAIYLALHLDKPLLLEGEAGVGKTEVAKVLAALLERELVRLQCYEGIDASQALYEWDYSRQLIAVPTCSGESFCSSGRCWPRSGPGHGRCC